MKVSIIVPIYNVETYLEKCIDSIIMQTYSNIEILLINDGSTDKSYDICQKFSKQDNRIKVINLSNSGVSNARNEGLSNVTGDYIMFVDGDDFIAYDALENIVNIIESSSWPDIIVGKAIHYYSDLEMDYEKTHINTEEVNELSGIQRFLFIQDREMFPMWAVWRYVIKKDVISNNDLKFTKGIISGEDLEFIIKVFRYVDKVEKNSTHYYYYRTSRSDSVMNTISFKKCISELMIINKLYNEMAENKNENIGGLFHWLGLMIINQIKNLNRLNKVDGDKIISEIKKIEIILKYVKGINNRILVSTTRILGYRATSIIYQKYSLLYLTRK